MLTQSSGYRPPGSSKTERNSSMACARRDGPVGRQMKPRVTVQGDERVSGKLCPMALSL